MVYDNPIKPLRRSRSFYEMQQLQKTRLEYMKDSHDKKRQQTKVYVLIIPVILSLLFIPYFALNFRYDIEDSGMAAITFKGIRGGDGFAITVKNKLLTNSLSQDRRSSTSTAYSLENFPVTVELNATGSRSTATKNTKHDHVIPTSSYSKEELNGKSSSKTQKETLSVELPAPHLIDNSIFIPDLNNLKDSWEPISPSDHAVFLHFPKTGGTTTKNILGVCHQKVLASEAGIKGHAQDKEITVIKGYGDSLFVNIDPTTPEGIKRAYDMGFADAHLADFTVTPFLYAIDNLFKSESKGRVFSMFRHPMERATSMLNYLKYAEWEPSYIDDFKTMTLEEYTKSPYVENNFYTRILSNTMEGSLTNDHFAIAVYNLRRKILVGLIDRLDESIDRLEKMFNWNYNYNPTEQERCRKGYLLKGANVGKTKFISVPEKGSEDYELLAWQNQYDLKLYDIVLRMFDDQKYLTAGKAAEYRLVDTTCSLCAEKKEKRTHEESIKFNLDADENSSTQ